jgi:hypothetical protein
VSEAALKAPRPLSRNLFYPPPSTPASQPPKPRFRGGLPLRGEEGPRGSGTVRAAPKGFEHGATASKLAEVPAQVPRPFFRREEVGMEVPEKSWRSWGRACKQR